MELGVGRPGERGVARPGERGVGRPGERGGGRPGERGVGRPREWGGGRHMGQLLYGKCGGRWMQRYYCTFSGSARCAHGQMGQPTDVPTDRGAKCPLTDVPTDRCAHEPMYQSTDVPTDLCA